MRYKNGFTLLEVLLVVTVIGILSGLAAPIYQSFQIQNNLDIAQNTITQSLYRAQVLSQASDGDSSWGVKINSGDSIVIFKGTSYLTRDTSYDEIFDLSPTISLDGGLDEVAFSKLLGEPNTTGNINLLSSTNETKTLTINSKGVVE